MTRRSAAFFAALLVGIGACATEMNTTPGSGPTPHEGMAGAADDDGGAGMTAVRPAPTGESRAGGSATGGSSGGSVSAFGGTVGTGGAASSGGSVSSAGTGATAGDHPGGAPPDGVAGTAGTSAGTGAGGTSQAGSGSVAGAPSAGSAGTGSGGGCLQAWKGSACDVCSSQTQSDRLACVKILDCYAQSACGPTTCAGNDDKCGANKIGQGTAGYPIAKQVYDCACP